MIRIETRVNGKSNVFDFPKPDEPSNEDKMKSFGQQFYIRQLGIGRQAKDKMPDELTEDEAFAICYLGGAKTRMRLYQDPETGEDLVDVNLVGEYVITKTQKGFVVVAANQSQPKSSPIDDLPQQPES